MSYSQKYYFCSKYNNENRITMMVIPINNDISTFINIFFIIIVLCLLRSIFIFNTVSFFPLNNTNLNDGNIKLHVWKF